MKRSKRIYQHMHIHYFHGENGHCTCGFTRDELIAQQKEEMKNTKSMFLIY